MSWFEKIPINYNVSLSFIVIFIAVLTAYMVYRFIRRINILTILAFSLQLITLTTGILTVLNRVQTIPVYELGLIIFGIISPLTFLLHDYTVMKKRIRKMSSDVPLVEKRKKARTDWQYEEFIVEPDDCQVEISAATIAESLTLTDKQIKTNVTRQLSVVHGIIEKKGFDKALDLYIILSGILNDNPYVMYNTAWLYQKNGLFNDSIKYYKKALSLIGDDSGKRKKELPAETVKKLRPLVHFGYGLSLYYLKKYELAINQFRLAQNETGEHVESDINIARCYIALGVVDEAVKYIKSAVTIKEDNKLRYLLASLCLELNEESESKKQLEAIVESDPDFIDAWILLGRIYRKNKDWKNVQLAYKKITMLSPQDADSYYRLAVAQREEGRIEEAINNLKFATELMPEHSRAYYCLASIYDAQGKTDDAIDYLNKSLQGREKLEMTYDLLAEILIASNRINEAIRVYEEATCEHPKSYQLHYNLGISLLMMRRYEEAVRAFKNAHKLTDDDHALYYNWASAEIGLKNYNEAARLYKEGLKIKSDDDEILFGLARVSALSGDVDAVLGFLRSAIDINPDMRIRAKTSYDFAAYRTNPEFMELTNLPIKMEKKHA